MPLIIIVGYPSSGKSTRTAELKSYLVNSSLGCSVQTVSDEAYSVDKNKVYTDSREEKKLRGNLKAFVQRNISKESVVIIDSLNYIKGYRYELFCIMKAAQTPHCLVWCDVNTAICSEWNEKRSEDMKYSSTVLQELIMRFEAPDSRNRWDSPLFIIHPDEELPYQQITDALFNRKPPPPNHSTLPQPLAATNFLHELDKMTQMVVSTIIAAQKTYQPGDHIPIPGTEEKLNVHRQVNAVELQRLRRQFISFSKSHPVEDTSKITSLFVQYLTSSLNVT